MSRARATNAAARVSLVIAVVWLAWRGIWRALSGSGDLAVRYNAAREWLADRDPYGFAEGYELGPQTINLDPPATLLAFIPLTVFSWPDARVLGTLVSVAAAIFVGLGVSRLVGWQLASPKALVLVAFLIAFAPVITTLALGQTGLLATAAIIMAMLLERSGRRTASGAAYGLATVFKFTVGLPFLAYLLWRRRWSPALASLAVVAGFTLVSVVRMEVAGTPWLGTWLSNLELLSGPGGLNDPDPSNEARLSLVNLQYPLSSVISSAALVDIIVFISVGATALAFVWLRRGRDAHPDLLALAMVAVLGLLVTYHRYYDAVVLAVPIAWACSALSGRDRRLGIVVLALCATFVVPVQSLANSIAEQTAILASSLTESPLWTGVVLAQHSWTLVLMAIALLVAAAGDRQLAPTIMPVQVDARGAPVGRA